MSLRLYGRGQRSAPIGYLPNGFPIYPIFGAEGEGNSGEDEGNEDENSSGAGGSSGDANDDDDDDDSSSGEDQSESLRRKMKAADRRASKAERELQELRDKDLSEKAKAEKERDEAKTAAERLNAKLTEQAIKLEFMADDRHKWHNVKAALKLLETDDLEVDDDFEVDGMKKAIDRLAKDHPYLIKSDEEGSGGDSSGGRNKNTNEQRNGSSGSSPKNGKNNADSDEAKRQAMEKRFPGLRNRIPVQ